MTLSEYIVLMHVKSESQGDSEHDVEIELQILTTVHQAPADGMQESPLRCAFVLGIAANMRSAGCQLATVVLNAVPSFS